MVGLSAYLEASDGERLSSAGGAAASAFIAHLAEATTCLRFIDPYGHTVFNRAQCKVLSEEWALASSQCPLELRSWWERVERLILTCRDDVHLYVRFVGD